MNPEANQPKAKSKRIGYIFLALSLVLNIIILSLILGVHGELDRHNKILITIPPDLQNEISAAFKQTAGEIKSEVIKTTESTSAQIIADAEKKNADALGRIDKQMAKIITSQNQLRPELVKLNDNIDFVVQADKRNHLNAEMAIGMARKAVEHGELQLAMIYALNAINHESSNTEYLKFYGTLLEQKSDLAISDIDQFISVLDLAVFQICASDVSSVVAMKAALIEKRSSMVLAMTEAKNKEVAAQIAANIAELREGRLALAKISTAGQINESLLKERLEVLSALLADASLSQDERDSLSEDLRYATGLYSISTALSAAKNAIAKADALAGKGQLKPTEILTARNQLQTGNTLLSQIWSSDCEKYQEFVSEGQKLQVEVDAIDKKLNIISSEPAKARLEFLIKKCRSIASEGGKYTTRIDRITAISKEFPQLLSAVYDLDLKKTLAADLESLSPIVSDLSRNRYKAYQEWAIKQLKGARDAWNAETVVSDEDAERMFNDYILKIDTALLLPDVNTLYSSLYQLIYNELPTKKKAEMQIKKAKQQLMRLEDF